MTQNTAGRRRQAARNDEAILAAAREVFLEDPKAPVAAVAQRAGVGISALYRRYPSKEELLRTLCHDGLRRFIAEAEQADRQPDDWTAFTTFLHAVVDADVPLLPPFPAGREELDSLRSALAQEGDRGAHALALVEAQAAQEEPLADWCR